MEFSFAHNVEEAVRAEQGGADYLGVGAVYPTSTKENTSAVSMEEMKKICQTVSIPVVAIGGIKKDNMNVLTEPESMESLSYQRFSRQKTSGKQPESCWKQ